MTQWNTKYVFALTAINVTIMFENLVDDAKSRPKYSPEPSAAVFQKPSEVD